MSKNEENIKQCLPKQWPGRPILNLSSGTRHWKCKKSPLYFRTTLTFPQFSPLTITGFSCIFNCSYQTPERWRIAPSKPDVWCQCPWQERLNEPNCQWYYNSDVTVIIHCDQWSLQNVSTVYFLLEWYTKHFCASASFTGHSNSKILTPGMPNTGILGTKNWWASVSLDFNAWCYEPVTSQFFCAMENKHRVYLKNFDNTQWFTPPWLLTQLCLHYTYAHK